MALPMGIYWDMALSGTVGNWMVGEQQNLSWHTRGDNDVHLSNISLVQGPPGGSLKTEPSTVMPCMTPTVGHIYLVELLYTYFIGG